MSKILVTLAALAISSVFALTGAPTASANPELCWNAGSGAPACQDQVGLTGTRGGAAIPGTGVGIGVTAGSMGSGSS